MRLCPWLSYFAFATFKGLISFLKIILVTTCVLRAAAIKQTNKQTNKQANKQTNTHFSSTEQNKKKKKHRYHRGKIALFH
jgi:hypothetical protein